MEKSEKSNTIDKQWRRTERDKRKRTLLTANSITKIHRRVYRNELCVRFDVITILDIVSLVALAAVIFDR